MASQTVHFVTLSVPVFLKKKGEGAEAGQYLSGQAMSHGLYGWALETGKKGKKQKKTQSNLFCRI